MRAAVFIATSVDGFIAREDGGIDWLPTEEKAEKQDFGYGKFIQTIDAIVMGRKTFELVKSFGTWPYGETPVFVLSSQSLAISNVQYPHVFHLAGEPEDIINELEARGFKSLYIDGGKTIQRFLASGLIDRIIITRIPVLLGKGIALFGPLERDIHLKLFEVIDFKNGFVQEKYEVIRQSTHQINSLARQ